MSYHYNKNNEKENETIFSAWSKQIFTFKYSESLLLLFQKSKSSLIVLSPIGVTQFFTGLLISSVVPHSLTTETLTIYSTPGTS